MSKNEINKLYFEWMCQKIADRRNNYKKLLERLHNTEFFYIMEEDENRLEDGLNLRHRFEYETGFKDRYGDLDKPCSVLEMMIALSIRLEEQFMVDTDKGNRVGQWFWEMIVNLGLGQMTDSNFDSNKVDLIIYRFMNREYTRNGKGGLFVIKKKNEDVRKYELWCQACWYINEIL